MSETKSGSPATRRNPLIWIAVFIVAVILYVFLSGDRGGSMTATRVVDEDDSAGTIDRSLLVPPGMRAREYIDQLREQGRPYPLDEAVARADGYLQEGSLADAHLLYFFAAREDYLPAIMVMAEMSDPLRFEAQNSLLDNADVIQAYKWYQRAAGLGHAPAADRISALRQWAQAEAAAGNIEASQLLLNYQ